MVTVIGIALYLFICTDIYCCINEIILLELISVHVLVWFFLSVFGVSVLTGYALRTFSSTKTCDFHDFWTLLSRLCERTRELKDV